MDFALRVGPELADRIGTLEVGQRKDEEERGAGSGTEVFETIAQDLLDALQVH